jgi:peptidoglycan/LPS O-acetylase OafA/YrhL
MMQTTQTTSAPQTLSQRLYALDWLRVGAFLLLVPYHTGMFFVTWDFHFKNPETSHAIEFPMLFLNSWRLSLLFLIAGIAAGRVLMRLSREGRSRKEFAKERFIRLFIPILFGMLVIIPPQIYYEHLFNHTRQYASYLDFWATVFQLQPYPKGSFSWHHLWFAVYIFFYSLWILPLHKYFQSPHGTRFLDRFTDYFTQSYRLYWIILPFLVLTHTLGRFFPTTHDLIHDWNNLSQTFLIFLWGYVIGTRTQAWTQAMIRLRKNALLLGTITLSAFLLYVAWYDVWFPNTNPEWYIYVPMRSVRSFNGLLWLVVLVGYASVHLNFTNRFLRYANEAVYPFYILHQSVMMIAGYYILLQPWGIAPKFTLIVVLIYLISWVMYEGIKRVSVLRLLFGLKVRGNPSLMKSANTPIQQAFDH